MLFISESAGLDRHVGITVVMVDPAVALSDRCVVAIAADYGVNPILVLDFPGFPWPGLVISKFSK